MMPTPCVDTYELAQSGNLTAARWCIALLGQALTCVGQNDSVLDLTLFKHPVQAPEVGRKRPLVN